MDQRAFDRPQGRRRREVEAETASRRRVDSLLRNFEGARWRIRAELAAALHRARRRKATERD